LVENREIFISHLYLAPPQQVTPSEFCESVWCCGRNRVIELPYGEKKLWRYVKLFSSDTGSPERNGQTDKQTDGRTSICWRAIKNYDFLPMLRHAYSRPIRDIRPPLNGGYISKPKIWDFGELLGIPPPKGETLCLGPIGDMYSLSSLFSSLRGRQLLSCLALRPLPQIAPNA